MREELSSFETEHTWSISVLYRGEDHICLQSRTEFKHRNHGSWHGVRHGGERSCERETPCLEHITPGAMDPVAGAGQTQLGKKAHVSAGKLKELAQGRRDSAQLLPHFFF